MPSKNQKPKTMRLTDTHCHLELEDYASDLEEVIDRAVLGGVERMISPGIDLASSRRAVEIARKYPSVFAAVGVHPISADTACEKTIPRLRDLCAAGGKVVAVGEVGLDYYRRYASEKNQKKLFNEFIEFSIEMDLPLILHNRAASEDFHDMLKRTGQGVIRGVVHCFSGDEKLLEEVLAMGFFISFAGNITFKKAGPLRELIRRVPLDKLLLETDSPYLAPEPARGRRNEPANVRYLLDTYAEIYEHTPSDIARITTHNADVLFKLGLGDTGKIAYEIRDSVYLNITNRCTNECTFCTREVSNYVKGHNLKSDREPEADEIILEMGDISRYREIVFCGFGEPTMRLDTVKKVADHVKREGGRVRIVTNGTGDIINGRNISGELKGLVDVVSVSLNAPDAETYDRICQPAFGKDAYQGILKFIKECREQGIEVEVTCLDIIGEEGLAACRRIANDLGAFFRLRHLNEVG
ncbi:MAG: YchF/TatD family DNA exonuclease [Candidatus Omnitrophica bacterium]|nr:YchF/TatD family DNA exonuclease [Candidatus Omnitrophota bacterium]MBU1657239.1 YchF/TatD family DNA exonuclease [Candidatus Omnitrophota bacterium]MBU1852286.1 YchF/TatD family DNA exonuclease [Candidatus Omnitrophota bacterium]